MKKTNRIIVGIDPDCNKSGVATIEDGNIKLETLDFPNLVERLILLSEQNAIIAIEAGYLNKSCFHLWGCQSYLIAARIGNKVGRNHETARKIVEMARWAECQDIREIKPLNKIGKKGKINKEEFLRIAKQKELICTKTSNQDGRDAGLIAINIYDYESIQGIKR